MTRGHQRDRRKHGFQGRIWVSREGRGSVSSAASRRLMEIEKNHQLFMTTEKPNAAGLSFLPIHIKESQNVKIRGNKVR
jgi:hypothetical protein